jgi:uncharacterized protein YndB with AHSA1/START domain
MSEIHIVREYPHPVGTVWRALTDPELVPRWTATGAGARPVGFAAEAGTRFQYVGRPKPGWDGVVDCVVLEVEPPRLLRFSWADHAGGPTTDVAFRLETTAHGTRLSYAHTGFTGVGGRVMAALLGRVRRKMLAEGLPPVLAELDGTAATGSGLG